MNFSKLWALGALVGAFGAASAAQAAPGPALPLLGSPNSISAGVFLPSSDEARAGGSTQFALQFLYGLPVPTPAPTRTVIGLGLETGTKSGNRSTVIPLTIGEQVSVGSGLYAGGGIGYYFINQHRNSSNGLDQLGTSNKVGGYGELGYSLADTIFVNAKYQVVNKANGFSLTAGLHF